MVCCWSFRVPGGKQNRILIQVLHTAGSGDKRGGHGHTYAPLQQEGVEGRHEGQIGGVVVALRADVGWFPVPIPEGGPGVPMSVNEDRDKGDGQWHGNQ